MRSRTAATVLTALALAALMMLPLSAAPAQAPRAGADVVGLWDTSHRAGLVARDCEQWTLNDDGFCTADDTRNGVELGVRFRTSQELTITGVRVYRVDLGTVTGSLWDDQGVRLATGTFESRGRRGWQDLEFDAPVVVSAGRTYVASYYSPATRYAFEYGFFDRQITRGPVTALRSSDDTPNGVHCYDVASCVSPTRGFRSSNYWVTPLWRDPTTAGPMPTPTPTATATPTATPEQPAPPRVTAAVPRPGATRVRTGATIRVTFSERVRAATLNRTTVLLRRKGRTDRLAVTLAYDAQRRRLTIDPKARLRPGTAYRVLVTSDVVDPAGTSLDQDPRRRGDQQAAWRFRTR